MSQKLPCKVLRDTFFRDWANRSGPSAWRRRRLGSTTAMRGQSWRSSSGCCRTGRKRPSRRRGCFPKGRTGSSRSTPSRLPFPAEIVYCSAWSSRGSCGSGRSRERCIWKTNYRLLLICFYLRSIRSGLRKFLFHEEIVFLNIRIKITWIL